MGHLGVVMRLGAVAIVCASAGSVRADTVTFDNGVTGEGLTRMTPDDFGTWGFLIGQQFDDEYYPAGVTNPFTPTYLTGPELYITTNNTHVSSVLLTGYKAWFDFTENPPPTPDGIQADPMHTGLTRTVTTPIAMTGANQSTSGFRIATDTAGGIRLDFTLVQKLTSDAASSTSTLDQIYTVTNNGTVATALVFHIAWDADLYYNGANQDSDDVVGTAQGLCGAYQHDGDPRWTIALGNGPTSTIPLSYYFGGKEDTTPSGGPPAFAPISAGINQQWIWITHGMPVSWQNYVVGPGKNAVGDSGTTVGDATLGSEYRFPLAVAATEILHVRRYYGTTTIPCFVSAKCGNGKLDPGELCDGADTAMCNGATCTASACGDGHTNAAAGEQCDSSGVDSDTCVGTTCLTTACGDGYVNAAAGEECETGELCDPTSCTHDYRIGGGCAGCGAGGAANGSWLVLFALLLRRRGR